jgi:hypothetical protein
MEKRDARQFQLEPGIQEQGWNIVELESRRNLRKRVNELIGMAGHSTLTTSEIRQHLLQSVATFGRALATQLVRSLHRDDAHERQSVVWLLTVLNDPATITPLQQMKRNSHLSRSVRLSASLALAGMGVTTGGTTESTVTHQSEHSQRLQHVQHSPHVQHHRLYAVR